MTTISPRSGAPAGAGEAGRARLKMLVLGHSHIQALRLAAIKDPALLRGQGRSAEVDFVLLARPDAPILPGVARAPIQLLVEDWRLDASRFRERVTPFLDAADHIFLLWQGGQFTGTMTLALGSDFDIVMPEDVEATRSPEVTVLPYSTVEESMERIFDDRNFETIRGLLEPYAKARKLSFLAPPPPLPSAALRERLLASPGVIALATKLEQNLESTSFIDDAVRVKVWRIMLDVYKRRAEREGSVLITPPREASDPGGLLAPQYWDSDVTHANFEYGRLYLDEIVAHTLGEQR